MKRSILPCLLLSSWLLGAEESTPQNEADAPLLATPAVAERTTFIPHPLTIEPFTPPPPKVPKTLEACRIDASVARLAAKGTTLTLQLGEASVAPDLPGPLPPQPAVTSAELTPEQIARHRWYPNAGIGTTAEAIKWGTLWLYQFAWTRTNNPNWLWDKRNQPPMTELTPEEEPYQILGQWRAWDVATDKYNGEPPNEGDLLYMTKFDHSFRQGLHYHNGSTTPIWPILTNQTARPSPQP